MRRFLMVLAGVLISVSACVAPGGSPIGRPTASPTTSPASPEKVPEAKWAAILADLSQRGIPTEKVTLVSAVSLTFNDGSLGCPEPGRVYTQALVEGMQVVVEIDGIQYDYRFGTGDTPRLCQK